MRWIDTNDIALDLLDNFPDVDPLSIRFTDLRDHGLLICLILMTTQTNATREYSRQFKWLGLKNLTSA